MTMMRTFPLVPCGALLFLCTLSTARAQETDDPKAHAQEASRPSVRFRLDAKLPVTVGTITVGFGNGPSGAIPVPPLVPGVAGRNWSVGLGLGYNRVSGGGNGGGSASLITIAPTATFDFWQSTGGRVGLYGLLGVVLAPGFGNASTSRLIPTDLSTGLQVALGAHVQLHRNFLLGLEAGPFTQFLVVTGPNEATVTAFYGALVGTVLAP
jgi:hypothetical protein